MDKSCVENLSFFLKEKKKVIEYDYLHLFWGKKVISAAPYDYRMFPTLTTSWYLDDKYICCIQQQGGKNCGE